MVEQIESGHHDIVADGCCLPHVTSLFDYLKTRDKGRLYDRSTQYNSVKKLTRSEKMRDSIVNKMKLESEAKKNDKTYQSSKELDRKVAKKIVLECLKMERHQQRGI